MVAPDQAADDGRQGELLHTLAEMVEAGAQAIELARVAADGLRESTDLDHVVVTATATDGLVILHASMSDWEREQIREYAGLELDGLKLSREAREMLEYVAPAGPVLQICGTADVAGLVRALPVGDRIASLAADAVRSQGIGSACVAPLLHEGRVVGAILGSGYAREPLAEERVQLIEEVADQLASALAVP